MSGMSAKTATNFWLGVVMLLRGYEQFASVPRLFVEFLNKFLHASLLLVPLFRAIIDGAIEGMQAVHDISCYKSYAVRRSVAFFVFMSGEIIGSKRS